MLTAAGLCGSKRGARPAIDSTLGLARATALAAITKLADGVIQTMKLHSTLKTFVALAGNFSVGWGRALVGGVGCQQRTTTPRCTKCR